MFFDQALFLLKEGKNVSRDSWAEEDGYLVLLVGMKHVWKIITKPGPNAGNHIFSVDELSATDWSVHNPNRFAEKTAAEEDAA